MSHILKQYEQLLNEIVEKTGCPRRIAIAQVDKWWVKWLKKRELEEGRS